jgi:DNA-binding Lrp family transcriptional regulator
MPEKLTAVLGIRIREGRLSEVEREVKNRSEIIAAYTVTGDYDFIAIGEFDGRIGLERFIREVLKWKYIERTHTFVALNAVKDIRDLAK